MPTYTTPGVYVEEVDLGPRSIEAPSTSTPVFIGHGGKAGAPVGVPTAVSNWSQFAAAFLGDGPMTPLAHAVNGFFVNTRGRCYVLDLGPDGSLAGSKDSPGLAVLEAIEDISIVCAPGRTDPVDHAAVIAHCELMRDRVGILDLVPDGTDLMGYTRIATVEAPAAIPAATDPAPADQRPRPTRQAAYRPPSSDFATAYHPWVQVVDLVTGETVLAPPSGHMAGIWARTDERRGVHKAPANEPMLGVVGLGRRVTPSEQGELNQAGVNVIRLMDRVGIRPWGARTLSDDAQWRYLSVRRLFCMVEKAIARGTQWIVFEPNDTPLWNLITRDLSAFLGNLWRDGALAGSTEKEAFFVKCDAETNPHELVEAGRVTCWVGLAPLRPAEFVVFQVSQFSGGTITEEL